MSILIAQDGLSFCTLNEDKEIENFHFSTFSDQLNPEALLEELNKLINNQVSEEVISKVTQVNAVFINNLYSIVPEKYFDEKNLTDYLKFNTKILRTDFITYDSLKNINANCVYIPYANINNYLFDKFGAFEFRHSATLFIDFCLSDIKQKKSAIYLHIDSSRFDICILQNNQLALANSFEFYTPEDFIYYVLFCIEQLQLDASKIQLYLCGEIKKDDKKYNYLYTYIKEIEFLNTAQLSKNFNNLSELKMNPKHHLLHLSNLL
ncbi:DUF3822 family protein [Mesonia aestuariivivens]|uniref:DUF3822 family protein n=1 Tax=Mesonia aestuariivivens TaxID=2796128 RepID=A0ABS6VYH8_9FLAO|nr:DUF3822 family protein [Mesonia aestuariivivens]MBW2960636.1 DUF3822 family protein [Mesonia aestuariivivens]